MASLFRLFGTIIFFVFFVSVSMAADEKTKDCVYCLKFEKLFDWPTEDRPAIFIYQENINYPKGMFGMENKMTAAGKKVGYRFVKKKKPLVSNLVQ